MNADKLIIKLKKETQNEVIYKFYDLESLTQEELNGLAREK